MSNPISTFNFKSNPVRIEIIKNEPYFCLADVCLVMNIQNSRRVNADMLNQDGVRKAYIPTTSGKQELTFINEPNLYRIIFKSRKAEAVEFQNWVFEEVLPQIRKTGQYLQTSTPKQPLALPNKDKISVDINHYQTLVHLARTASSACSQLMERQNKALEAFGFAFSPLNSLAHQTELVKEMQFAIDDAETNFRRHLRNRS